MPVSRLICGVEGTRRIELAELGLTEGSRPLDLALGKDTVWVLLEPSLLVGVPRRVRESKPAAIAEFGEVEELLDQIPGPPGSAWSSLAVDSWDGSVWLASAAKPALWRMRPGRRPQPVKLSQTPAVQDGGLADVAVGQGAVWVAPACAGSALWRLDSSGKVRSTALDQPGCAAADLERDWSGTLWALRAGRGEVFRLRLDGTWEPADKLAVPAAPAEQPPIRSWFFWGTEPVALAAGDDGATVLYRRTGATVTAFQEDCGGSPLVRATGDRWGWTVLTRQFLLVGEFPEVDREKAGSD